MTDLISSKEIINATGISRSTLNNYIKLGILPKPIVQKPEERTTIKKMGYFPRNALDAVEKVRTMKREGYSMDFIAGKIGTISEERPPSTADTGSLKRRSLTGGELPLFPPEDSPAEPENRTTDETMPEPPAPFPTAVLAASLQEPDRLSDELPPDEYAWLMDRIARHVVETGRKKGGLFQYCDGFFFYFQGRNSGSSAESALNSAMEIQDGISRISREWASVWSRSGSLHLNIGISSGEECLIRMHGGAGRVITIPGDAYREARFLSFLAKGGTVWATKKFIITMESLKGARLRFGFHRDGRWEDRRFCRIGDCFPDAAFHDSVAAGLNARLSAAEVLK